MTSILIHNFLIDFVSFIVQSQSGDIQHSRFWCNGS